MAKAPVKKASKQPAAPKPGATRRVALRLPADLVAQAETVARARREPLDAVVAGFLRSALGGAPFFPGMGREHLAAFQRAFAGLSEEEMLAVDGILMTEPGQAE